MIRNSVIRVAALLIAVLLVIGCGARQSRRKADAYAMLKEGRFAEARAAVLAKNSQAPRDRALVAISLIAEAPDKEKAEQAIQALVGTSVDMATVKAGAEMLKLVYEIPQPVAPELSLLAAETSLGAVGQGPMAPAPLQIRTGEETLDLGIAVIERIRFALSESGISIDSNRVLSIWNGCFALMGNTLEAGDDYRAWQLFQNIGDIAAIVQRAIPESDLAKALLDAAIITLETNPSIAVAAKCDLGSPFEQLRSSLAYNRDYLGRLEIAVSGAFGCNRGTYAPIPK